MYLKFSTTLIIFFFVTINISAKTIDGNDSLIIRKYWNRVNIKSISSVSNTLYVGIDNYLQLVCPDKESAGFQFYLTTNNGEIYDYEEGTFLTIPVRPDKSFITIHVITDENDTLTIGKKQLAVAMLPTPVLKYGSTIIHEHSFINRKLLESGDTLKIFFSDDLPESSDWYLIENFSVGYTYSQVFVSTENLSPVFKEEALKMLAKLKTGSEVVIKVISVSPSGLLRNLPLVRFYLQ